MSRHCPKIFLIHTFFPGKSKKCLRTQLSEWMMRLRDTWERSRNDLKPGSSYSAWICVLTQMNSWTVTTDLSVSRAALFHYRFFCPGIIILTFFLYNKFTLLFTLLSCKVPAFNQVGLIYIKREPYSIWYWCLSTAQPQSKRLLSLRRGSFWTAGNCLASGS